MPPLLYFDLETGGLCWWPTQAADGSPIPMHPIIQFGAVVADPMSDTPDIIDQLELKIQFRPEKADSIALSINHYHPAHWANAIHPLDAAKKIMAFISRHAIHERKSPGKIKTYFVAQPAGHNCAKFDLPFLHAWLRFWLGKDRFIPLDYHPIDTMSLAAALSHVGLVQAPDYKLTTLARVLGCPLAESEAHDALADVRATLEVHRRLLAIPSRMRNALQRIAQWENEGPYDTVTEAAAEARDALPPHLRPTGEASASEQSLSQEPTS